MKQITHRSYQDLIVETSTSMKRGKGLSKIHRKDKIKITYEIT